MARVRFFAPALVLVVLGLATNVHALTPSGARISSASTANYKNSLGVSMPASASNTVVVTVAQVAGVQVPPTSVIANALPGSTGYTPITVQNAGNGADRFGLTVAGAPWSPKVIADANGDGIRQSTETTVVTSTPSVAAGGSYKCFLAASVPAGTTASGSFTLTAASLLDTVKTAQRNYNLMSYLTGAPSLLEAGEPIRVIVGLSASAGARAVTANGARLIANGDFWSGNAPAGSAPGSHNVDIAITDASGNVEHNTGVLYTTARVVVANGKALNSPAAALYMNKVVFKVCGKASQVTANSFVIDDGSGCPVTVNALGHNVQPNDFAQARGILQKTTSLTMRTSATKVSRVR